MSEPRYRVKNWGRFQHYNKPRPAWIKLHRTLLDDHEFHSLSTRSRALLVMLWLIAAESDDGTIPDEKAIAWRLRMPEKEIANDIKLLGHYLDPIYTDSRSGLDSDRDRDRDRDREETEGEREGERAGARPTPAKVAYAEFVHMTAEQHATLVKAHGTAAVAWMIAKLDAFKGSKGKTYKCDYRAILSWVVSAWNDEPNKPAATATDRKPAPLTEVERESLKGWA